MKKLILGLGLLFMVGCGGLDGDLSVQKAFVLKDKSGSSLSVPAGDHEVNLNFNERKRLLSIEFKNLNGNKKAINTETPKNFKIPEQGTFSLAGKDFGQEVDLFGDIRVQRTRSEERWGQQNCQYNSYETVCRRNPEGNVECREVYVPRNGFQDIRYYLLMTVRNTTVIFRSSGTSDEVAKFQALERSTSQQIIWQGTCR